MHVERVQIEYPKLCKNILVDEQLLRAMGDTDDGGNVYELPTMIVGVVAANIYSIVKPVGASTSYLKLVNKVKPVRRFTIRVYI